MERSRLLHENFAKFFERPTRGGLRDLLRYNPTELSNCEFKAQWPDYPRLSKHILGVANSGGGCLIIGIDEKSDKSLDPVGLPSFTDAADIQNGISPYIPNILRSMVEVGNFAFSESEYRTLIGKNFQVMIIEYDPNHIPFLALRDGTDIRASTVYIRRQAITEPANHDELQRLLNTRIETGHSTRKELDLKEHLDQLRALLSEIPRYRMDWSALLGGMTSATERILAIGSRSNPAYPTEDFDAFILRMIEAKKKRIEQELDVSHIDPATSSPPASSAR